MEGTPVPLERHFRSLAAARPLGTCQSQLEQRVFSALKWQPSSLQLSVWPEDSASSTCVWACHTCVRYNQKKHLWSAIETFNFAKTRRRLYAAPPQWAISCFLSVTFLGGVTIKHSEATQKEVKSAITANLFLFPTMSQMQHSKFPKCSRMIKHKTVLKKRKCCKFVFCLPKTYFHIRFSRMSLFLAIYFQTHFQVSFRITSILMGFLSNILLPWTLYPKSRCLVKILTPSHLSSPPRDHILNADQQILFTEHFILLNYFQWTLLQIELVLNSEGIVSSLFKLHDVNFNDFSEVLVKWGLPYCFSYSVLQLTENTSYCPVQVKSMKQLGNLRK